MPRKSYIINRSIKNKEVPITGIIDILITGEAAFYYGNDRYPTFISNKEDKFVWKPDTKDSIPNLAKRLYPTLPLNEAIEKIKSRQSDIFKQLKDSQIKYYKEQFPILPSPENFPKPSAVAPTQTGATGGSPSDPVNGGSPSDLANGGAELKILAEKFQIESIRIRQEYSNYVFPEDLRSIKEVDCVKFKQQKYTGRNIDLLEFDPKKYEDIPGGVYLPIQSASDTNTVSWNEDFMNPLQAAGAAFGLNLIESDVTKIGNVIESGYTQFIEKLQSENSALVPAFKLWAASQAVGLNNLLSRTSGAILNNNLELLFASPQLRSFTFNYLLNPRNEKEATHVRGIIRFFKEGMVVQRTASNLFLKSPNVFKIEYLNKRSGKQEQLHQSLNRIKNPCALTNFQTNYTPNGSYMTFNDEYSTMTSYSISMTFTELEPLYSTDYTDDKNNLTPDEIGY